MQLLCLSNGHGEDAIALRIVQQLQHHPQAPQVMALPLVGAGYAYTSHGIPLAGPVKSMPSGGFIYMDGRQLVRDVQGGLVQLTLEQLTSIRAWAKQGGTILAVGDIVPLLFAWWSGAPYAFVGTAKSDYYLRDEAGFLPRRSWFEQLERWSGSVYLPWERWLMSCNRCKAVFPRDTLTTDGLKQWSIPAFDMGNPMMDGVSDQSHPAEGDYWKQADGLTIALLPGSRAPEAYENWLLILQAVTAVITAFPKRPLRFLAAIAPALDLSPLLTPLSRQHWQPAAADTLSPDHPPPYTHQNALLVLSQTAFWDYLDRADFAIAMAGTATEQFVGLGKPAITLAGRGPQFTYAFAEAQTRLLGPSAILVNQPQQVADALQALLNDPDRLQRIAANGRRRLGQPGAAHRIAHCLMEQLR